jgi:hypothetical protein
MPMARTLGAIEGEWERCLGLFRANRASRVQTRFSFPLRSKPEDSWRRIALVGAGQIGGTLALLAGPSSSATSC